MIGAFKGSIVPYYLRITIVLLITVNMGIILGFLWTFFALA